MRIVISRRSARGGLLAVAMAGPLFLGATGCGGDEDPAAKAADKAVAGTELCGGDAVSADAAEALKVITGESRLEASAKEYSITKAASALRKKFITESVGTGDICRVFTPVGTPEIQLRITWDLARDAPTSTDPMGPEYTELKMGETAWTTPDKALVEFACRSDKLAGSNPAHIGVEVMRWGMPKDIDDESGALKDAYATVAHSISVAMAEELGCAENGGLPAKVVLDRA
ncbi:hypothetical protein [Streptomyces sp. NPDC060184]|uniref:hypothetical protein n=1 Tax=Streptomyces sp. NPDC060184 TaxID=3347064 RepID=UPI00364BA5EC